MTVLRLGVVCTVVSCGLFPTLGDLTSPADGGAEDVASSDAALDTLVDVHLDAPIDGPSDAGSPGDAAWTFVSTEGNYVDQANTTTVMVSSSASAGQLVLIGCDSEAAAGLIGLDSQTSALAPHKLGPYPNAAATLETIFYWGVLATTPGPFTMTATTTNPTGFLDCSINVYTGGTANAAVVDSIHTEGADAGLTTCGPVSTARGGVAYYIAVRYTCAGAPNSPWTQRQDLEGNPTGDIAPTTGMSELATLGACGSELAWECLTVSLSP